MNYFAHDTIIAVATSLAGDGGVGILRLSGPGALDAAQKLVHGLERPAPRYLHRIRIVNPEGQTLDDGLGVFFPEGASFTGEPVVELQIHGGRYLLQSILKLFISSGSCRLALPGEFSFRAVRNGKMSLNDAQAVKQLVNAKSQYEVWSARQNLSGGRREDITKIADRIRQLLAMSELSIDFIDQDVEVITEDDLKAQVLSIFSELEDLKARVGLAQRIANGPLVVFAGAPNAGKSTLFNAILAEDRAIVSAEAGTTRDVITEEILVGPYRLRLADTAGLRLADNAIEREGITRTESMLNEADAVILLLDGTEDTFSEQALQAVEKAAVIALNKADLVSPERQKEIANKLLAKYRDKSILWLSGQTGQGVKALIETLKAVLDARFGLGLVTPLPTEYQTQMIEACAEQIGHLKQFLESAGLQHPELISAQLAAAAKSLSDIAGETTPDTILNKIFAEFCIGK